MRLYKGGAINFLNIGAKFSFYTCIFSIKNVRRKTLEKAMRSQIFFFFFFVNFEFMTN